MPIMESSKKMFWLESLYTGSCNVVWTIWKTECNALQCFYAGQESNVTAGSHDVNTHALAP